MTKSRLLVQFLTLDNGTLSLVEGCGTTYIFIDFVVFKKRGVFLWGFALGWSLWDMLDMSMFRAFAPFRTFRIQN